MKNPKPDYSRRKQIIVGRIYDDREMTGNSEMQSVLYLIGANQKLNPKSNFWISGTSLVII